MAKKLKSLNPIIGTGYKTLSTIKDGEDGNIENFPDTLPKIPRLSYKRLGVSGLEIGWEFEDKIYYTYELYGSTTKGFEASEENLMFQGLASSYFYEAKPGEKWYFKARAKNTHGRYTEFSSELVTYTVKLDNLGEYVEGGSINGALIENATINNAHIKDLHADKITAGVLDADRIGANSITANKIEANAITTEKIQANAITTDKLAANIIASNHIQSGTIESGHIKAGTIESDHIKSNSINSNHIQANTIQSEHIQANTIQSEHIQTGAITAGSGIIAEGAIGSAQISSLDAAKIEAGTIDTSKVTIQGADGHLRLKGNRLQVFQGTGNQAKERVSVGDVNGNGTVYGLRVRGADGQTILLDENGVKSEGITDGAITNDKISDDANIDGAKLNINSVVNKINEDGTETIQGTKIEVDGTTLNTKLSTITTKQTEDSERISQAQSQITANTNAIKLKVDEQTYTADKKDMTSKLEKNTSEISTMKGQIALKVEQTDIQTAINNLEIGGRNYALGTITPVSGVGENRENQSVNLYSLNKAFAGNTVTTSFDWEVIGDTIAGKFYTQLNGTPWSSFSNPVIVSSTNKKGRVVYTKEMPSDLDSATMIKARLDNFQGALKISNLKIELGTKSTDWTPAPEDVDTTIDTKINSAKAEIKVTTDAISQNVSNLSQTVSTKADGSTVTTLSNKVGSLETSVNGISGKVTNLEKTTTTLGGQVSNAQNTADSAVSKANSAQNTANTANNTANSNKTNITNLQGEVSTVKSNIASLEVTTSGISQKVSSVESTTATLTSKVNTVESTANQAKTSADNANNKVDNMSIGGRNLAQLTSSSYSSVFNGFTGSENTCSTLGKVLTDGLSVGDTVTVKLIYKYKDIVPASGKTASCWIQGSGDVTAWNSGQFSGCPRKTLSGSGEHTFLYSFKVTDNHIKNTCWNTNIRHDYVQSGSVQWKMYKVEKGTKATDWTPAPEDIDSNLNDVKNSLNSFQNTVNTTFKDGIIEEAEAKAISQHLKTLDAEKADIDKEYSTIYSNANLTGSAKTNLASAKTSFDSAHASLKSTINTVISDGRVSSSESASVTSTFNTYNTQLGVYKQRIQEALDAIGSAKVDNVQIGGRNLLRNTSLDGITFPYNGSNYNWRTASTNDGNGVSRTKVAITDNNSFRETIYGIKFVNTTSTNSNYDVAQDNVKMEDGVTYTMSAYFKVTSGNPTWRLQYGTSPYPVKTGTVKSGWNKYSYTFKYDKTQFSNKLTTNIYFGFAGANFEGYICGFKLEKGNKATDWSPAPEDIDGAINSVDGKVTTLQGEYNTTKSKVATLETNLDGITQRVSSTESTTATLTSKVNTVESTANSANSKIDNLAIGGANIIKNTKLLTNVNLGAWTVTDTGSEGFKKLQIVTTETNWQECQIPVYTEINTLTSSVTVSFEYYENTTGLLAFSLGAFNGNSRVYEISNIVVSSSFKTISRNGDWKYVSYTFDPTSINGKANATQYKVQFKKMSGKTGTIYVRKPMLEIGTKPSSWSPAPEDVDEKVNNALQKPMGINLIVNQGTFAPNQPNKDGEFYIHGFDANGNKADVDGYIINPNTGAKITIPKTSINPNDKLPFNQEVYLCYSNRLWLGWYSTSEKRWKVVDANANTYQNTVSNLVWDDSHLVLGTIVMSATEMCASGVLFDSPKNYREAVGQTIEFTTTKSQVASIQTDLSGITSRVSSVEDTTTTVKNDLANLNVGGRNLIQNSAPNTTSGWSTSTNWTISLVDCASAPNGKAIRTTNSNNATSGGLHKPPVGGKSKLIDGETYTISAWIRASKPCKAEFKNETMVSGNQIDLTTSWKYYKFTSKININATYHSDVVYVTNATIANGMWVEIHSLKLEKGNKATDWSEAPEEISGSITSLTSRVSTAESKITEDAITNTVKKNFYTKSETDNQITSKGYQTESQVQQTVNGLEVKVKQSGGYNNLFNSGFKRGTSYWSEHLYGTATNKSISTWDDNNQYILPNTKALVIRATNPTDRYGVHQNVKVKEGATYSISALSAGHRNTKQLITIRKASDGTHIANIEANPIEAGKNINNWRKMEGTFTIPSGCTEITVCLYMVGTGNNSDAYVWYTNVLLSEGKLVNEWSPHPSEIYDGVTTIDKDGVTVTASNVKSKTNMSANGFKITKTDTNEDVFKVNSDGTLYMKGQITVTGGSIPTSNLSGTISSNQLNSSITSDINNAKNNASSALSTANTASTNATNALNTANSVNNTVNSNKNNWNNAYNRVKEWASGAVTGSTNINGGMIATNTILANKIALGDWNNYAELNSSTYSSYGFTSVEDSSASNNPWFQVSTLARDKVISKTYTCKGGETFRVTGEIYSTAKASSSSSDTSLVDYREVRISVYSKSADGTMNYQHGGSVKNGTGKTSATITLPSTARTFYVSLQINGWSPFSGTVRVRNVEVKQMSNSELIVDGSIKTSMIHTDGLNANVIKAGTISADRLDANTIVSKVNGGTTEINGNRIQTGTLSASKITTGELNASKVNVTNLNASNITSGTISGNRIASNSITADKIAVGAISVDRLSSNNENPIIKLFDNCSIDATAKNEQGKGSAIRLKWDSMNYILQKRSGVDFYMEPREVGNAFGFQSDYGQHTNNYESRIITRDGTLCFRRTNNNNEATSSLYFYTGSNNYDRKLLTSYDLTSSVTSTSTTLPATANAVKQAYDKAVSAYNVGNHSHPYASSSHSHSGNSWEYLKLNKGYINYLYYVDGNATDWCVLSTAHLAPNTKDRYLGQSASSRRWQGAFLVSSPNVSSDATLKENIEYLDDNSRTRRKGLLTANQLHDFIKNDLRLAEYDYKIDSHSLNECCEDEQKLIRSMNNHQIGFIAQDIVDTEVGAKIVTEDSDGILGYETGNFMAVIAGALQEEIKRREELEAKCVDLEERLIKLEKILESKL